MRALERLELICDRNGFTMELSLVGPTGHPAKGEPIWPQGEFRLRVMLDGQILAGRAQSQPGRETVDELADGCLLLLRRRGVTGA